MISPTIFPFEQGQCISQENYFFNVTLLFLDYTPFLLSILFICLEENFFFKIKKKNFPRFTSKSRKFSKSYFFHLRDFLFLSSFLKFIKWNTTQKLFLVAFNYLFFTWKTTAPINFIFIFCRKTLSESLFFH